MQVRKIMTHMLSATALMAAAHTGHALTLPVVSDPASGIHGANMTATLDDGTVLGFYSSNASVTNPTATFCGAISRRTAIDVPDSLQLSARRYAVTVIGGSRLDFDNAPAVISMTIPATITYINDLPLTLKELHAAGYVKSASPAALSGLDRVLIPERYLDSYLGNTDCWLNNVLINAEGTDPLCLTIDMTRPGEFAQRISQHTDNWLKVNELTVTGPLGSDDLAEFRRMKQLTRLDLSHAGISDIPEGFDGRSGSGNYNLTGFGILRHLTLPALNSIGRFAFSKCTRLTDVSMPAVRKIGDEAFYECGFTEIALPEGLTAIGSSAFARSELESIVIPSTVTDLPGCFANCTRLASVTIPPTVSTIGAGTFTATALTSVSLPGVSHVGNNAFKDCTRLTTVTFSDSLRELGGRAFAGCTALTEIDLPVNLWKIGYGYATFQGCTGIRRVSSRSVIPPVAGAVLDNCDMSAVTLYVPAMSVGAYRSATGWSAFSTILPLEEKTRLIDIYAPATIEDPSEFTDDCRLDIDYRQDTQHGKTQYSHGALLYEGTVTMSAHDYRQYQHLGKGYDSENPYSYGGHFTSLIADGPMRADNVTTILRTGDTEVWYFISLPYDVRVSEITHDGVANFVIRRYAGKERAQMTGNAWQNLAPDSIMHAREGYILRCDRRDAEFHFPALKNTNKNLVFTDQDAVMPLQEHLSKFAHNRSWNLIGNPYPCWYDTRFMDFTAPITVWNRYLERYDAYSPVDDSYILHPSQAFFVQRPVDSASVTFAREGRQTTATARASVARLPGRTREASDRHLYNITLTDGNATDRTRVVINSDAFPGYELDKDAFKFTDGGSRSPLAYTVADGVRYAINERPADDGLVSLGYYAPSAGAYTFAVDTPGPESVTLIDLHTGNETEMPGTYRFDTGSGYNDGRFILAIRQPDALTTPCRDDGGIRIDGNTVTADAPYTVYRADGRLSGHFAAGETAVLAPGIYVISSNETKRKIAVRP